MLRVAENFILSMKLDTKPTDELAKTDSANESDTNIAGDDDDEEVEVRVSELEKELIEMVMIFNTSVVDASSR